MRSVRCDACGTKALTAASKCPKCSHPIEVRDGFGGLLPLAHCHSCDSYYPESIGTCKWCGTTPQRAPMTPHIWKGVGIAAFVAMAWGAWLVHDDEPKEVADARMRALLKPDSTASDSSGTRKEFASAGNVSVDSAAPSTPVVSEETTTVALLPPDAPVDSTAQPTAVVVQQEPVASVDSPRARDPEPEPVVPRVVASAPARTSAPAPARVPPKTAPRTLASSKPTTKASAKASSTASKSRVAPKPRTSARWVSSVSRNWVVVRATASSQSRIIASIGPNTRVQLGESRGGWRRVKAKGLAGWVEHRSFFAGGSAPRRAGRLAAR